MTQNYSKRLIEVDLPIRRVSEHARREKSIRHGHISTLHIWWARRPLAACRAVICAALWPDPADELCPASFRDKVRTEMRAWTPHERQRLLSEESRKRFEKARQNPALFDDAEQLRRALLDFIADFANWDNSTVREYMDTSRALTQAEHEARGTYVRTLAADMGKHLGCGAHLKTLRRTACGHLTLANAVALDELERLVEKEKIPLVSLSSALSHLRGVTWQRVVISALSEVHVEFILIHPFREGNGRVGRILCTLMALQANVPLLDFRSIQGRRKGDYFASVRAGRDRNYKPMEEIFELVLNRTSSGSLT